ncbi:MAG: DUF2950 domain-containing protein [bacterium]|nr:DUF2950 domain-containing protein [bacterium]
MADGVVVAGAGKQISSGKGRVDKGLQVTMMEEEMTFLQKVTRREPYIGLLLRFAASVVLLMTFGVAERTTATTVQQMTFPSAEEAVKVAIAAVRSNDDNEMLAIFGADARDIIFSGDPVADKSRRQRFLKAYEEKHQLIREGDNRVLVVGKEDWPFPIPMVKKDNGWVFDTEQGKEEILNRRIGENELSAIQVLLAIVDAQREYVMEDRDGNNLLEYAQKFRSDAGRKNGLYWEAQAGEAQSPLGPLVAQARSEGYKRQASTDKPIPYHGYYYNILSAQGKNASGGAYDYVVKGKLIGGFALVARPAEYGNSGVMTFVVNHDGNVFEKDLGNDSESIAAVMKAYNPDSRWAEVKK